MKKILVSLYEKEKYVEILSEIESKGWEIWASSGTAKFLREKKIKARDLSEVTGFESLLGGLVKTLHPQIFAGILSPEPLWNIVLVDLYPPPDIDIGGVALLRAAAKNWTKVKPAFDLETLKTALESDDIETRKRLAALTFAFTSQYDSLRANQFMPNISLSFQQANLDLRYGENPHERAWIYGNHAFELLSEKKKISFNNVLDAEAAWFVVNDLTEPAAVVVKHQSPCGAAIGDVMEKPKIVAKAIDADRESSYGGILAVNFELDEKTVGTIDTYLEVIVAPSYTEKALEILSNKRTRVIKVKKNFIAMAGKFAFGSLLVSERKLPSGPFVLRVGEPANDGRLKDLKLAYTVAEGVKSNAIVIAKDGVTVGIGGGQPSRKRAAWIATSLAGEKARGAAAASDAFFPFPDGLETLARAGVKYVVAPLGSIRDEEVLNKAMDLGITFYEAPGRVFRH
ncbi:MAG: phosphoribosylaminoimidazolecarboxamide formyltransferase / cyclohydrolase [Thermotogota bacterium]|nr:phosphoribosylaminoimidazolecarboxamide formyltransferase / cyclohydrolase [Thermotogota bacterium]